MTLTAISSSNRRENFSRTRLTSCLESRNQAFQGSRGLNDTNSHHLARMGDKKIFHELDVHHVQILEIKRFLAHEAKMSLTAKSSLESARRKFFLNSTYIMSRKQESNRFWAHEAEITLTAISSMDSARRKFFINSTYIMYRKKESTRRKFFFNSFLGQEAEVTLTAISLMDSARRKFFINSTYIMYRKKESNVFGLRRPK